MFLNICVEQVYILETRSFTVSNIKKTKTKTKTVVCVAKLSHVRRKKQIRKRNVRAKFKM